MKAYQQTIQYNHHYMLVKPSVSNRRPAYVT